MSSTHCITSCDEVTYVLLCENDIYYVGKTKQLHNRLTNHFSGNGTVVTRTHPPIKVVGIYAGDVEKNRVLFGRKKYGKDKCFGHCYHLNSHYA